jgi:glycosyltransferase involved in cell wall biosynthesis
VAAGAAGMYCGTCIHDNTLAAALQRSGHEVALLPLYTPLRTDEENVSLRQVFYGAVNVYLQQKSAVFRHTPRALARLLDRPAVLDWVSRFAASTDAAELGALTLSVLRAEDGRQRSELDRLTEWLREFDPDVVQIANSMLLGIATDIKRRIGAPIVCGLTGEDIFLDELPQPYRSQVADELRRRAREADAFVATSRYYADAMVDFLRVPAERVHVVHLGINLDSIGIEPHRPTEPARLTIGYMARICPEKGLHLLLEAFRRIAESRPELPVAVRAAGYVGGRDREYFEAQRRRVRDWGLADRVELLGEVDLAGKRELLMSSDVVSVPTTYREPKGLFVLEALAHGVPVVQPDHGAFPELVERTGGGILVAPDSPDDLAAGLLTLLDDPARRRELGRRGREAVRTHFNSDAMTTRTLEVYGALLAAGTTGGRS